MVPLQRKRRETLSLQNPPGTTDFQALLAPVTALLVKELSCQMDFSFKKRKGGKKHEERRSFFLVSNPVVWALPMGSVNHFLLADRNNFSFRNGTFMFCGFSVYTHFATLCQHLLMNKYITGLTENEVLAEARWLSEPSATRLSLTSLQEYPRQSFNPCLLHLQTNPFAPHLG